MVFAAVAIELLPDVVSKHAQVSTVVGFALGVALMLMVREISKRVEGKGKGQATASTGLLTAVGVDITVDGFLIGIGFAAGATQGILLTVALTLELLSLGLATMSALRQMGTAPGRSILTMAGLALFVLVGAVLGVTLLAGLTGAVLDGVLAFGVAALLYLVTEELLVEAHEVPETAAITSMFFVGFLLLPVIDLLV